MDFGSDTVQRFLEQRRVMMLGTVNPGGVPLVTPVWFVHTKDALFVYSMTSSRKVRNIAARPQVSVAVEQGERAADIRFVIISGHATVVSDPDEVGRMSTALLARYGADLRSRWGMDRLPPDRSMVRVIPARVFARGLD